MSLTKEECEDCVGVFTEKICLSCPDEHCSVNCEVSKSENQLYQLIDKYFETVKENTVNFKHFHLLADSTLKSWKKDDLIEYIHILYHNWKNDDYYYNNVMNYIKTLQDENDSLQSQLLEYQRVCKQK